MSAVETALPVLEADGAGLRSLMTLLYEHRGHQLRTRFRANHGDRSFYLDCLTCDRIGFYMMWPAHVWTSKVKA